MNDKITILIITVSVIAGICYGIAILSLKFVKSIREEENDNEYSETEKKSRHKVTVYAAAGNIIKQYSGCTEVEYDDVSVTFNDENGKLHDIYHSSGIVIVDEE